MSTSMIPRIESLSFRRTVDVPLEACVAALNDWLQAVHGGEVRLGTGQLLGPMAHDHDLGTHRIQVRLARGPLSPLLPMRLDLDFWSPSSTTLELIPGRLVRPTPEYFRAGNALIDSLIYSLSPQRGVA